MARPEGIGVSVPAPVIWHRPMLFVGCGNMAGAILLRLLDRGLPAEFVTVVDPAMLQIAPGLNVRPDIPRRIAVGTMVWLGIKPQMLGTVAPSLDAALGAGCSVVSMLAGVPVAQLRDLLPRADLILRIMPNLPVRIGQGVVLAMAEGRPLSSLERETLDQLGLVEPLPDEALFDLATAVSGCGPAFLYRFVDALGAAATHLGLDAGMAARLAVHTVAGAALTALGQDRTPAERADAVASPGGMTREGLNVLDEGDALVVLLTRTLRAARDRGEALARLGA